MSTSPRLTPVDTSARSTFGAIRGHHPELSQKFSDMYGYFWQHGIVDLATKEATRIRNARIIDCGY